VTLAPRETNPAGGGQLRRLVRRRLRPARVVPRGPDPRFQTLRPRWSRRSWHEFFEPELPLRLVAVDPALIAGHVEPRIEQFKPILDDAIPGRRAVLEKGPVAVTPAVAR
jgi:hypothetical protein